MLPHQFSDLKFTKPTYYHQQPSFSRSRTPPPSLHGRKVYGQKITSPPPKTYPETPAKPTTTDHGATATLPAPCLSFDSLDISQPSSHDSTDRDVVTSSASQSLAESAEESCMLSFDQALSRLKPFLDRTAGERTISIDGISLDIVHMLQAESEASKLPGWENARIDFSGDKLIVHYLTLGHEIMSTLFFNVDINGANGHPLFSIDKSFVRLGGSANVHLEDGIKSPDYSLYENNPMKQPLTQGWPTVVWEVAYSENEKKLARDLARYVACSLGRVRLAIGVNIECNYVAGQRQGLKKVTCTFWEADYAETFTTLEESGSLLNHLTRCDDYADEDEDHVVPTPTKFSCVSKFDGEYIKFVVSQQSLYTIFPGDPSGCTKMDILNRHLSRTSPAKDQNKPAITIPFSALRRVIISHEEQQSFLEIGCNMKKRQYGEGTEEDKNDRKNKEDVAVEISRLKKKPRINL
ncbi:hypothetical protein BYT27DRAFT_7252739 [Phlegmacium glaucopus]|nr:hypothetical protein BYT27DRAFT_7252739 [Phlegmacium glaucopus]